MGNNILQPIPMTLNNYLLQNGQTVLSDTIPAAPEGATNVTWQFDQFGNISAYTTGGGGGGAVGAAGTIQSTDGDGAFTASSIVDDGTVVTFNESIHMTDSVPAIPSSTDKFAQIYFSASANALEITASDGSGTGQNGAYLAYNSSNGADDPVSVFLANSSGFTSNVPIVALGGVIDSTTFSLQDGSKFSSLTGSPFAQSGIAFGVHTPSFFVANSGDVTVPSSLTQSALVVYADATVTTYFNYLDDGGGNMQVPNSGNSVSIGTANVGGNLTIGDGSGNGKAPIALTPQATLLATPIAGSFEYDGTHLYFTTSTGTRQTVTLV